MSLLRDPHGGWDELICRFPNTHFLQSEAWSELKSHFGWTSEHMRWEIGENKKAAASVLTRTMRFSHGLAALKLIYIPRGPLMDWTDSELKDKVLTSLEDLSRQSGVICVKIDPEVIHEDNTIMGENGEQDSAGDVIGELVRRGWRFSAQQVQFANTVWIELNGDEETWLGRMKQKTRYNIRLAERKGVNVRQGDENDLQLLYRLYLETSKRDGFLIRDESYYLAAWRLFLERGLGWILVAEVEETPVAAVFLVIFHDRCWYLYGMSNMEHREKMPNYLLQWEAMRLAKSMGCKTYDLWGAPTVFDQKDQLWNVFRFKQGLGGKLIQTIGAWDYSAKPLIYQGYTRILPGILDIIRLMKNAKKRKEVFP